MPKPEPSDLAGFVDQKLSELIYLHGRAKPGEKARVQAVFEIGTAGPVIRLTLETLLPEELGMKES